MVDQFLGTWRLVSSENFEEFLKEKGVGLPMRKAANNMKPDMIVSKDDNGMITIKMKSSLKTKEFQFKLDEPFEGTTMDDKPATNVVTLEDGKLVQKSTFDGKETTFEREIIDDKLILVKSQQADMMRILESKSIQYELIDISLGLEVRNEMRNKAGNQTAVPPQLFNDEQYCGDFKMFSEAVEADTVEQFLKMA